MVRGLSIQRTDSADNSEVLLSIFPTEIGWMGILGHDQIVVAVVIGHPSAATVRKEFRDRISTGEFVGPFDEKDWLPELRQGLMAYAKGDRVEFGAFQLQLPPQTTFRDRVLAVTRSLPYGKTISYGELARAVGHPGAARAVGTVMSTNRFPILIPCHRVLAAGGKLGGFTSRTGTVLKQKLLEMEQVSCSPSGRVR
jgi:methylated-DNA-[protein]-cysteine S-methyltransferase